MLSRLIQRGLLSVKPQHMRMAQPVFNQNMKINAIVAAQQRAFAKRGRKKKNDEGVTTDEEVVHEEAPVVEEPVQSTPDHLAAAKKTSFKEVPKDLFVPFSVGDVKVVNSTPDHKPPTQDDTIDGRYASVLFTSASQ